MSVVGCLLGIGLGAISLFFGFYIIARGLGSTYAAEHGDGKVEILGIKIEIHGVGPGVFFAFFGTIIIIFAIFEWPPNPSRATPTVVKQVADTTTTDNTQPPVTPETHGKVRPIIEQPIHPPKPPPVREYSLLCEYNSGLKSGRIEDFSGVTGVNPQLVGGPCQDGAGSQGIAVKPGTRPAVPVEVSSRCQFISGALTGEIHDYAPLPPVPVGYPCHDGMSVGVIVK